MTLGYLISPVVQIVDSHGKPIVGAKIYVYKAGTTNTVNTYRDFSNHYNSTPVLTDTLGNCTIIAPDDMIYDIVVKDNRNNLLMSKDNLTVSSGINPDINLRFNQGYGIIIRKNGNTVTISVDTDVIATKSDLVAKQDKLTGGDNIEITQDNTVNVVNRKTLYTQWPLKVDRGSSMVKLYLDQDFVDNTTEILPGADLIATYDEFGHKIIGVDTNSSATGNYNFYAGYDNEITGNYNTIFGYDGSINGDGNFIAGQSDNSISGYGNAVFGTRNTITNNGTYNLIQGIENKVNHGSNNLIVGSLNETNGHGCVIGGSYNSLYCDGGYYVNNLQLGDRNVVSADYVNANLLYGDYNTISGQGYRYNIIGGSENTFDCGYGLYNTLVLGYRQTFSGNNVFERNIIAGDGNVFGNGLSNSLVVGSDNNAYSNNVEILGDGHNVSAEYNTRLGKYSTNGDYWFAIGNGTDDTHRSNVFEVRKNNDIYFEYNNEMHQLVPGGSISPVYLDSSNFPIYYSFTSLDGQTGDRSWLNVPDAIFYNGIVKDSDENCYSLVDQSNYKLCEVDADFVIKIDAMPSNSSVIDIEYGAKADKSISTNTLRNVIFYATGVYYIHYHCIFTAKNFYFCGANRSYLVGGGTAGIYLQNVTIRSV